MAAKKKNPNIAAALAVLRRLRRGEDVPVQDVDVAIVALETECPTCDPTGPPPTGGG